MAISYVGGVKSPTGWGATTAVPALATVSAGDLLLAYCAIADSGSADPAVARMTAPDSGWTRIASEAIPVTMTRVEVFAKIATGPLATQTWKWASEHWSATFVVAYRGAALTTSVVSASGVILALDTAAQTVPAGGLVVVSGWATHSTGNFGTTVTKRVTDLVAPRSHVVGDTTSGTPQRFTLIEDSNLIVSSVLLLPNDASRTASIMYVKSGTSYKRTTLTRKPS